MDDYLGSFSFDGNLTGVFFFLMQFCKTHVQDKVLIALHTHYVHVHVHAELPTVMLTCTFV